MYDLNDTIELVMPGPDGDKICEIKNPTPDQWYKYYDDRYTVIRNLGRGESETKPMGREAASSALLEAIQVNKAVKFDETEAVTLMDQLANLDVVDVIRAGGSVTVVMQTLLGEVTIIIKMPGHKELKYATEACVKVRGGRFNSSTVHISLKPAVELYDTIAETVKDYSTTDPKAIPAVHKYKVIDILQGEINQIVGKSKRQELPTTPGPTSQV